MEDVIATTNLDIITYTLCATGALLNIFAFFVLRNMKISGKVVIRLVLLSDSVVCIFYAINQWCAQRYFKMFMTGFPASTASTLKYWEYSLIITRTTALASVGVSNWWLVYMLINRCLVMSRNLAGFLKNFVENSVFQIIVYALCWIFTTLQTVFTPETSQSVHQIVHYCIPMVLVVILVLILLCQLRLQSRWHYSREECSSENKKCHSRSGCSPWRPFISQQQNVFATSTHSSNLSKMKLMQSSDTNLKQHQRRLHQIAITMIGLAVTFLVFNLFQIADLCIWFSNFLNKVYKSTQTESTDSKLKGEQLQNIVSIVKNTCALAKCTTNFFFLCLQSSTFRNLVQQLCIYIYKRLLLCAVTCRRQLSSNTHTRVKMQTWCYHCALRRKASFSNLVGVDNLNVNTSSSEAAKYYSGTSSLLKPSLEQSTSNHIKPPICCQHKSELVDFSLDSRSRAAKRYSQKQRLPWKHGVIVLNPSDYFSKSKSGDKANVPMKRRSRCFGRTLSVPGVHQPFMQSSRSRSEMTLPSERFRSSRIPSTSPQFSPSVHTTYLPNEQAERIKSHSYEHSEYRPDSVALPPEFSPDQVQDSPTFSTMYPSKVSI